MAGVRLGPSARATAWVPDSMAERLRVIDIEEEQDGTAAIIDGGRDVAGDDTRVVVQRAHLVRRRLSFQG